MVKTQRETKNKKTIEKRFYITSSTEQIENIAKFIRGHWGIEKWLTLGFRRWLQRRSTNARNRNLAMLRRISFNHLKQEKIQDLAWKIKDLKLQWTQNIWNRFLSYEKKS